MKKIVSSLWGDVKIRKIQNGDRFSMESGCEKELLPGQPPAEIRNIIMGHGA